MRISNGEIEMDFRERATGRIYTKMVTGIEPVRVNARDHPKRKPSVGDAVRCLWEKNLEDSNENPLTIHCIFIKEEERFTSHVHQITFPEVPPDLHPNGYYG